MQEQQQQQPALKKRNGGVDTIASNSSASPSEQFTNALYRQAVARVCCCWGIKEMDPVALDVVVDVVSNYIKNIATTTLEHAELSGRCTAGIQDVLHAIGSNEYKHLREFAFTDLKTLTPRWNQPFHHNVPLYPVAAPSSTAALTSLSLNGSAKKRNRQDATSSSSTAPATTTTTSSGDRGENVPDHLPNFPPKHTYSRKVKKSRNNNNNNNNNNEQKDILNKTIAATKSIQHTLSKLESI